ncbi:MAG: xanthine dehydrogenase family protein molybdopterin-binding subunit [Candidatus Lustribacter sp.]|jgi:CO/xanthine dehydrogenase Mo-binding subunit
MTTTTTAPRTIDAFFERGEYRVDGREKVSGKMRYTADFAPAGLLWAAFTTSPHAHAKIVRIDTTEARAVPGVRAVLTSTDIGPGKRSGRMLFDYPVLAYDKVIMIGDRVAAVAAETREAAEEAARLVVVEYEELPAILDPFAAMEPGAPVIHPEYDRYHYNGKTRPKIDRPNLQGAYEYHSDGEDIDAIFARAPHVFEHRFHTARQHAGYLEPKATVVWIDGDGTVHVQTPNKAPYALQRFLAHVTGLPAEKIVIEPSAIGGDFGSKGWTTDEYPCYYLAAATGRPIKRVSSYTNELTSNAVKHATYMTLQTAVDEAGTFIAHRSTFTYNGGAYAAGKPSPFLNPGQTGYSTVPYAVPHVEITTRTVYTNTAPGTHVRAPGNSQLFFAWEQHVDLMAAALGIDPLELRKHNVVQHGQPNVSGEHIHHPMGAAVLERLGAEIAANPPPPGRAWGVSIGCRHTGGGKTSLELTLQPDGTIDILSGVPDQGGGGHTVAQRVAAVTLGIPEERIRFRRGSTREAPADPGAGGSRVTHIVGRAAQVAAETLRERLQQATGMTLRDGRFVAADGRSTSFEEGVSRALGNAPLRVAGEYDGSQHGPDHPGDYSFSGYGIEVGVDRETGEFTIHDAVFVADVGRIINPVAHQGQVEGGFIFGLGTAAFEELLLDESGKVTNPSLADYKLPTIRDIPPLRTVYLDAPGHDGPFGAKMAGELSNTTVAAALSNAIANAAGIRLHELPITPERIYRALHP